MNIQTMISNFFSPLSLGEGQGVRSLGVSLLLLLVLLASCGKDDSQQEPSGSQTTGRTIRRELTLQIAPMQGSEGEGATRVITETPLNADEAKIHDLTVLQFGGTTDASLLIKQTTVDVSEINATTGAFFFDFEELTGGGQIKVYLLANIEYFPYGLEENVTTLDEFEGMSIYTEGCTEDEMKAKGLPMLASQSFDVKTANPAPFQLKSLYAKVVFSFDTTTDFKVGPFALEFYTNQGVFIKEPVPGDSPWLSDQVIAGGSVHVNDEGTYAGEPVVAYISESLLGRNASITEDSERGGSNVPDEYAACCHLYTNARDNDRDLSNIEYHIYLGDGTPQDFNVVRHHQYNVHVTLRGVKTTDKRVTLKAANCYIVTASDKEFRFLGTVMGNGAVTPDAGTNAPEILPIALRPASAKVLWEQSDPTGATNAVGDVIKAGSVSTDGTYITFTTGTKPGNAVIAALDGSGAIIWSWHIWRPESGPGDAYCHTTANGGRDFQMMDRNLGAFNNNANDVKAYGLLYQWGRKDPFPNATSISYEDTGGATFKGVVTTNGYSFAAVPTAAGVTVQGSIQTPMNFYCDVNEEHNTDWLPNLNDNLWGTPYTNGNVSPNPDLGSKSIYDPCPVGYRVPPQDTWNQATEDNSTWDQNGYQLGVGTGSTPTNYFYPAAGVRWGDSDAGKLVIVSSGGCYWSSSPYYYGASKGGHLDFNDGSVSPENGGSRVHGMSVRCVQEL